MSGTWPIRLARGPIPYRGNGYRAQEAAQISAEIGLHWLQGNARPYWSVTGEITTAASRRQGDCDAGGCIHPEILHHWPDLAPIVALHGADDTGAPMHAEENAIYHAGRSRRYGGPGYYDGNATHLAGHLRISLAQAEEIMRDAPTSEWIRAYVDAQRERWQAEHDAAIAWLQSVGAIETVHDGEREREI